MLAKELMSSPVITVQPDATLKEIVQLLSHRQISSVPVVDADEQVLGIIGWTELFPSTRYVGSPDVRAPAVFNRITDPQNIVESYQAAAGFTASEIMSPDFVYRDVDDNLDELIYTMAEEKLHMIPIVQEGRLVGVVTRTDVVRFLAKAL
jgi:CBS domain-containing protein